MADIFQDDFLSEEPSDMENPFSSGDDHLEVEKKDEEEESKEETDEDYLEAQVEPVNTEPKLPTLEDLANSDYIRNRALAAKSIVDYLHQAGSNEDALHSVISVMCKLFEDEDLMVRSELMEHIPSIALYCKKHSEDLGVVIRQQIVPYTVKLITDVQHQIRKIGQTTLLILLENNIIDDSQLTEWICPFIAQLATSDTNPSPENAAVMCKMIPYVGKEITEKFFLEPFLSLCCNQSSSAREICMVHFGSLSKVLGRESTESILLPIYLDLCKKVSKYEDEPFRIKCVEMAVDLASIVSPSTRREVLSFVYTDFLNDQSQGMWVYAYRSLGRFISTFADPVKTGLCYRNGVWIDIPFEDDNIEVQTHNTNYFECLIPKITSSSQFLEEMSLSKVSHHNLIKYPDLSNKKATFKCNCKTVMSEKISDQNSNISSELTNLHNTLNCEKNPSNHIPVTVEKKDGHLYLHVDNENVFNNFQYWRTPLPDVDIDIEGCKSANISVTAKTHNEEENLNTFASELSAKISPSDDSKDFVNTQLRADNEAKIIQNENRIPIQFEDNLWEDDFLPSLKFHRDSVDKGSCRTAIYNQNIVPPELLIKYIDDVLIEEEVERMNIAYYFPSVAYTLGRKNWPCIRGTFHWLATDIAYNVKKTVAMSLHELAIILGRDISSKDLFPVFRKMLGDEQVRPIVLKYISKFLRHLRPSDRRPFLEMLPGLCSWEDRWEEERDWRYRLMVSEQLIKCIDLFTSCEALHFFAVSLKLLQDKVCAVRKSAVELLTISLRSIARNPKSSEFVKLALSALDEKYRKSNKWLWRQVYVFLCQELAVKKSFPTEFYVEEIVPNLFSLTWDTVPNVRLAVARCLGLTLLPLDFLPSIQRAHYQLLLQVMYSLQSDVDKDVRHFAHLSAAAFNVLPPKKISPV